MSIGGSDASNELQSSTATLTHGRLFLALVQGRVCRLWHRKSRPECSSSWTIQQTVARVPKVLG